MHRKVALPGDWRRGLGRLVNVRGDLFAAALTFIAMSVVRLISSLLLTRLLYPEAYGIVAVVASVLFVIEMLSDVGVVGLVVRHERGEEADFINTLWTVRFGRSLVNAALAFIAAPWVGLLYGDPAIGEAVRVLSLWFLLAAPESMAFAVAMRHQRSRLVSYVELGCTIVSTAFAIGFSYFQRDHWGMVYSMLVGRALSTIASHFFYTQFRPRFRFERSAWRELLAFGKFVMPTSILTMALAQYDKVVFLRLFDLRLLGVYGIAGSVAMPIASLVTRLCQFVLYPRCAEVYRNDPESLRHRYYRDNRKLLLMLVLLPAAVGGCAQQIVELLFDVRYLSAGMVLQFVMIRIIVLGIVTPAESLLTATGYPKVQLVSNALRILWIVPASLLGFYFFGFPGFVLLSSLDAAAGGAYVLSTQYQRGLMRRRLELARLALVLLVWGLSFALSGVLGSTEWWQVHFRNH